MRVAGAMKVGVRGDDLRTDPCTGLAASRRLSTGGDDVVEGPVDRVGEAAPPLRFS